MGYYSQFAITLEERAARKSAPDREPRDRLLDRIADLKDRLEDFSTPRKAKYGTYDSIPDRSLGNPILRYVLPEDLLSYDEVQSALMLAESDLWEMDHKDILSITFLIPGQMFLTSVMERGGRARM